MRQPVLAFIMAGGKGTRLEPLTAARAKPSVPFGGKYRIIDFVLSNFVNSGMFSIYVLTQFKSQSLTEHLQETWNFGNLLPDHFIIPVPAQQRTGELWYQGTADAIWQNCNLITDHKPDEVAVFGGDHIYKMNVASMVTEHRATKADVSIAAIPVPIAEASSFGVIQVDAAWRVVGFQEKPKVPTPIPGRPDLALASMGNYLFSREALIEVLRDDAARSDSSHDFGKDVLPRMLRDKRPMQAFDFSRNRIPGSNNPLNDSYWRDVGTLESYYDASIDLRAVQPLLDLYNQEWPIRSTPNTYPPAKFVHHAEGRVGQALQSIVCEGSIISGATVVDSIIGTRCRINSFADVNACVLHDDVEVGRGARLRRCIVDKHVTIPPGDAIGFDRARDALRFHVTETGLVVIAKHQSVVLAP